MTPALHGAKKKHVSISLTLLEIDKGLSSLAVEFKPLLAHKYYDYVTIIRCLKHFANN